MGDERSKGLKRTFLLDRQDPGATSQTDLLTVDLFARLSGPQIGRNAGLYGNIGLTGLVLVCKGHIPFREHNPGTIAKDNSCKAAVPSYGTFAYPCIPRKGPLSFGESYPP